MARELQEIIVGQDPDERLAALTVYCRDLNTAFQARVQSGESAQDLAADRAHLEEAWEVMRREQLAAVPRLQALREQRRNAFYAADAKLIALRQSLELKLAS